MLKTCSVCWRKQIKQTNFVNGIYWTIWTVKKILGVRSICWKEVRFVFEASVCYCSPQSQHGLPHSTCTVEFHITFSLLCTYSAYSTEWEIALFHWLMLIFSLRLSESLFSFFFHNSLSLFGVRASIHGFIILFLPLQLVEVWGPTCGDLPWN